ncbi:MAG: sigma-54-dependent Fis family transcriptional regulator [Planctomycetes bacterium]|nr:sigma-54-dependent Fis family transcriptional regulator [Planctomycetota bacterium]
MELTKRLLELSASHEEPAEFLDEALPALLAAVGADYVAVLRGERGRWEIISEAGLESELPYDLLGEVLDREIAGNRGDWSAAPLSAQAARGEVLAFHAPPGKSPWPPVTAMTGTVHALDASLASVRSRYRQARKIRRLQTILEITCLWRQSQRTDELLNQIAEASTQLLGAERASIFLWDKRGKTLVGRPALGVEDGELRIADDVGVVGEVLRSGQVRRVDAEEAGGEIDRRVDRQLSYSTRNLICAPLRTPGGELFGAFEVLNKQAGNFTEEDVTALSELATHAAVALESTRQYEQLLQARNQMADQAAANVRLIGQCPAIEALRSTIGRIADTDLAILILGENGTGKEVVAQMIHYLSRRRNQPFVAVNCAALSETLLESELFGHEKGAFTDAYEAREGKFELASGGTLLLDEIGDMSPSGQAKLLRVLEEKVVVRVGGSRPITTDARVIAATNQNLAKMVREKRFREDLFFRLNVVTLDLPPLRERGDDVLLLAEHFLKDFCAKARRSPPDFTAAARRRMLEHTWPGNIREVRNLMERLAYLSQGDRIEACDLAFILTSEPSDVSVFQSGLSLSDATHRFQSQYIQREIEVAHGNMTVAAERLGLHRSNLYRKMRQLDMTSDDEQP